MYFDSVEKLERGVEGDHLKYELQRLGLKSGGNQQQLAARLWLTRGLGGDLSSISKKHFAQKEMGKGEMGGSRGKGDASKQESRLQQHSVDSESFQTELQFVGGRKV